MDFDNSAMKRAICRTDVIQFDFQLCRQLDLNLRALGLDLPDDSVSLKERSEIGMMRCEDYYLELEIMIGSLEVLAKLFSSHYQIARSFDSVCSKMRKIQELISDTHEKFWTQYRHLKTLEHI